ncbi:MAG TPA: RNA 2',3'-cyclic phosphodiesterase [Xanthomonadaceae bacterium]|nr:RNA 2',3'-cyclic phosphodiesterase [Xanthomonadaceae bacterium]
MRRSDQASLPGLAPAEVPRGPPHRLFFALWPDPPLREAVAATVGALVQAHPNDGRRLRADRYHMTLQFLGDIAAPRRDEVVARATAAAAEVESPAFDLLLDHAGSFPNARVWWLAPTDPPAGLRQLWDALGVALLQADQKPKASPGFSPHLTVVRDVGARLPETPVEPLRWRVDRFVLIDSQPPRPYRIVGQWPLSS